jgi:hypothetical protein
VRRSVLEKSDKKDNLAFPEFVLFTKYCLDWDQIKKDGMAEICRGGDESRGGENVFKLLIIKHEGKGTWKAWAKMGVYN